MAEARLREDLADARAEITRLRSEVNLSKFPNTLVCTSVHDVAKPRTPKSHTKNGGL
jgi:hypothetical protein